ncbi:MAG: YjfB family protein, partial [Clostridium sp.]|nr:YjfB family protein [Clostridium sp.]
FIIQGKLMDIAMLSVINNHNKVNDAASLLVLKKAMDTSEENAANMAQLLNQSVNPNLGTNFDKTV